MTFIDDFSQYCYAYLIRSKNGVLDMFKTFRAEIEIQTEKILKRLRAETGRIVNTILV